MWYNAPLLIGENMTKVASGWGLNDNGEIVVKMGTGGTEVVGDIPNDFTPTTPEGEAILRIPELQDRQVDMGFFDYNDTATAITPISVTSNTWTKLTNNGLGVFTNKLYRPPVLTDVWNTSTNKFVWTNMKLGDTVGIRLEIAITTTSPNQVVNLSVFNAVGTPNEYSIGIVPEIQFKLAGSRVVNAFTGIYMGDNNTLLNPSEIRIKSDANCSVIVSGWYVRTILVGKH